MLYQSHDAAHSKKIVTQTLEPISFESDHELLKRILGNMVTGQCPWDAGEYAAAKKLRNI